MLIFCFLLLSFLTAPCSKPTFHCTTNIEQLKEIMETGNFLIYKKTCVSIRKYAKIVRENYPLKGR